MTKKPIAFEMTLDQIKEKALQLSRLTDATAIYYFGGRRWDAELSFGPIEFVVVTPEPAFYNQAEQEVLLDKLMQETTFEVILTFIGKESDVMSRAFPVWPLAN